MIPVERSFQPPETIGVPCEEPSSLRYKPTGPLETIEAPWETIDVSSHCSFGGWGEQSVPWKTFFSRRYNGSCHGKPVLSWGNIQEFYRAGGCFGGKGNWHFGKAEISFARTACTMSRKNRTRKIRNILTARNGRPSNLDGSSGSTENYLMNRMVIGYL
jgi:hypothetical protein